MGRNRQGREEILGSYGYGSKSPEGDVSLDLFQRNLLIIGMTGLKKKNSQKITRYGWGDRRTKTLIDYVLVEKGHRKELMDVTAMPEEAFGGDHRAVVAKLKVGKIIKLPEKRERKKD